MYDADTSSIITSGGIASWAWAEFLLRLNEFAEDVVIVSYNYDLFLERALTALGIPYSYGGLGVIDRTSSKIRIYKPHGSINFVGRNDVALTPAERPPREIDYRLAEDLNSRREVRVESENLNDYWLRYAVIPPAGESSKLSQSWNRTLHEDLLKEAKAMRPSDLVVACGISYWHVDRTELDAIIAQLDPEIRAYMINPAPSAEFDSVLSSLFQHYTCFSSGAPLLKVKL
ncbi:SIR2 family protein [Caenimonas koreensis]|uniref:SIR2 family protein n=1 Tax=Caenimonas koreensis TaxID=367474 RepID=UPI003784EAA3